MVDEDRHANGLARASERAGENSKKENEPRPTVEDPQGRRHPGKLPGLGARESHRPQRRVRHNADAAVRAYCLTAVTLTSAFPGTASSVQPMAVQAGQGSLITASRAFMNAPRVSLMLT